MPAETAASEYLNSPDPEQGARLQVEAHLQAVQQPHGARDRVVAGRELCAAQPEVARVGKEPALQACGLRLCSLSRPAPLASFPKHPPYFKCRSSAAGRHPSRSREKGLALKQCASLLDALVYQYTTKQYFGARGHIAPLVDADIQLERHQATIDKRLPSRLCQCAQSNVRLKKPLLPFTIIRHQRVTTRK